MTSPRECVAQADSGADRGAVVVFPLVLSWMMLLACGLGLQATGIQERRTFTCGPSSRPPCIVAHIHTHGRLLETLPIHLLLHVQYTGGIAHAATAAKLPPLPSNTAHHNRPGQDGSHKHGRRLCSRSRCAGALVSLPGNVCPWTAWQRLLLCLARGHHSDAIGRRPDVGVLLLQRHVLRHDGAHFLQQSALTKY